MKHVVIVGGGFAGLNCARKLALRPDIRVTLIDKNNYQQFQCCIQFAVGAERAYQCRYKAWRSGLRRSRISNGHYRRRAKVPG